MKVAKKLIATLGIISLSGMGNMMARGVTFAPPPEQESPQQGVAASSRSGEACGSTQAAVKATSASVRVLVPRQNYGTTISAHPEILVYVPETSAREALFVLKNASDRAIGRMEVTLSGKGEIITIEYPETAPALEVGETYKWYFMVKCPEMLRPKEPVEGLIKRIEMDGAQLPSQDPSNLLESATAYASAGIWYDAVATMDRLRKSKPNDRAIANHWNELLASAGLNDLVNVSIGN